jgi:CHRD domain
MKPVRHLLSGLLLFTLSAASQAAFINFTATLTNGEEFPASAVPSTATGSLTGILDTDTNQFTWTVVATGLTSPVVAMHFHGNTPSPPGHLGVSRPVVLGFAGGGVDPDVTTVLDSLSGSTSGSYIGTADLDLALNDRGGSFPLTVAQQIAGLRNTEWYVNVHTSSNTGGEIRGQVFLASPTSVPVPAALWFLPVVVAALAGSVRRRA